MNILAPLFSILAHNYINTESWLWSEFCFCSAVFWACQSVEPYYTVYAWFMEYTLSATAMYYNSLNPTSCLKYMWPNIALPPGKSLSHM